MTSISSVSGLDPQLLQQQATPSPSASSADHDHDNEATETAATKTQEKMQSGGLNIIA